MFIGVDSATAEAIFNKMDETLIENEISWDNCIGLGVDNTSVNIGIRNSIRTRVLTKNSSTYVMGCPCHIVHNTALKASASFLEVGAIIQNSLIIIIAYYNYFLITIIIMF